MVGLVGGAVVLAAAPGALMALRDAQRGRDLLLAAEQSLRVDDVATARSQLTEAREAFGSAEVRVSTGLARPANLVPGLGRHLRLARELAGSGALLAEAGQATTDALDKRPPSGWRDDQGRVDIQALRAASSDVERASEKVRAAQRRLGASPRRLILPPLGAQRAEALGRVGDAAHGLRQAVAGLGVAPKILGADGPKRYYLTFSNLAELRGTGGLLGFYTILRTDDGRIELGPQSGRAQDEFPVPATLDPQAPEWFLHAYGRFKPFEIWQNINFSTDFPTVAEVLLQSLPSELGSLDGVIQVDPVVLEALLEGGGPVSVPGWPEPLTSQNISEVTQYEAYIRYADDNRGRIEFLDRAVVAVFDRILTSELDISELLLGSLGEAVAGGHVQVYSRDPQVQGALGTIGLARGVSRTRAATDVLGFLTQNGSGNKIDWFLRRSVSYQVRLDPERERVTANLTATLTSSAPASGLPDYILEAFTPNVPYAVNRALVGILRPPGDVQRHVRLEGEALQTSRDLEAHLVNYQSSVDIGPGESRQLTARFVVPQGLRCEGRSCFYRLHVLRQPVAHPDAYEVRIEVPEGWVAAGPTSFEGPLLEDLVLEVRLRQSFRTWAYQRVVRGPLNVIRNLLP